MFVVHEYNGSYSKYNFGNGYFNDVAVSAGTNASGNGIFELDVPTGYTAPCTKGNRTKQMAMTSTTQLFHGRGHILIVVVLLSILVSGSLSKQS